MIVAYESNINWRLGPVIYLDFFLEKLNNHKFTR